MNLCADEKISKTENKALSLIVMLRTLTVKTDNCWKASQLYSVYFNNQAKNLVKKNGTGSRFGRKIGRDGGIEKKKRPESGIGEPLLWTLKLCCYRPLVAINRTLQIVLCE